MISLLIKRLYRRWRRMLETKLVDDNLKMLVTVLAFFAIIIHYVLYWRWAPSWYHQHLKDKTKNSVINITMSPTSRCHQYHDVINITVSFKSRANLTFRVYKIDQNNPRWPFLCRNGLIWPPFSDRSSIIFTDNFYL